MKSLQQIRAAHAIGKAHALDKRVINKIPALILTNGLLPAAAFTLDSSESRKEMCNVFEAVADHLLKRSHLGELSGSNPRDRVSSMIKQLSAKNSTELQRATAESIAYLGFLKRFAVKGQDPEN